MDKKKKKKWTTKNTHIKRLNKSSNIELIKWYDKVAAWIIIACASLLIILIASNNHIVGYDNYIGIPKVWVQSLFE